MQFAQYAQNSLTTLPNVAAYPSLTAQDSNWDLREQAFHLLQETKDRARLQEIVDFMRDPESVKR